MAKKYIEYAALGLGLVLMLALFNEGTRVAIGRAMEVIFGPLASALPFHIVILILASITGVYSAIIQRYTIDYELAKRFQAEWKKLNQEYKEAMKTKNQAKLKKLQEKQRELMRNQSDLMMQQFKPMLYIGIISIPIWLWIYLYTINNPELAMIFPFFGEKHLTESVLGPFSVWIVWYILCSIPIGQVFRKVLGM
ncbi:MAG: EMC3/TMCO1 family protein [Methanocellales archaeon]